MSTTQSLSNQSLGDTHSLPLEQRLTANADFVAAGFVLPIFVEMSHLFTDHFSLNLGVGNRLYDPSRSIAHALIVSA